MERLGKQLHTSTGWLIVLTLFCWGLWSVPVALLGPERDRIPGDLGDARYGNYVLEHFHRFSVGKEPSYWNAPFMYPQPNALNHTDHLAGSAPIYDLFRRVGWRPESAYQLWIIALFGLNYLCAWSALRGWGCANIPAACGAFIYAFGIQQADQLGHPSALARFAIPLAMLGWWRVLHGGGARWWSLFVLATVLQFWCARVPAYFLVYGLLVLTAAYAIVYRSFAWIKGLREPRELLPRLAVIGLGAALLLPLVLAQRSAAPLPSELAMDRIPQIRSHFLTHPAALSWRSLNWGGGDGLAEWWYHQHFLGGVVWVGVLLGLLLILLGARRKQHDRALLALSVALLLVLLLCLRVGELNTFTPAWWLMGSPYLGAVEQVVLVQGFFAALIVAWVGSAMDRTRWGMFLVPTVLPLTTVIDHRFSASEIKHYDKHDAMDLVETVDHWIQMGMHSEVAAMAWCPVLPPMRSSDAYTTIGRIQLTAMLAGQQRGVAVVNAVHKFPPSHYGPFLHSLADTAVSSWLSSNARPTGTVLVIDNIGAPFERAVKQVLSTADGRWISSSAPVDPTLRIAAVSDALAACYTVVELRDGRLVLLASNDRFVAADLSQGDGSLRADGVYPGDFCLFQAVPSDNGHFTLRADNGLYVTVAADGVLRATAVTMEQALLVTFQVLPAGIH